MPTSTPFSYTATQAIAEIRETRLSASDWLSSCAERIQSYESEVMAWAFFDKEIALAQAREIDRRLEEKKSVAPLYGAPIGVKDIFNSYDMPTRRGSAVYETYQPRNDARAVARLRWSHGIIAGKTASDEFAVHWPAETRNPYHLEHTPGGSSSGSAAAVACGMVPLALASQTLGSTIRPASYCGIYGLKPTFGLIPRTGMFKTTDTLDHVGLMARSIEDIDLFLEVIRLKGLDHPYIHQNMDLRKEEDPKTKAWKIAVLVPPSWVEEEKYAHQALEGLTERLRACGVAVDTLRLPALFEEAPQIHETIYNVTLSYYFQEECRNHADKISDWFRQMVEKGLSTANTEYYGALAKQNLLTEQLQNILEPYDALLTLASSSEAPKGRFTKYKSDTCLLWTLCRVPALSVPAFKGPNGLPFGVQLVGKRYDDFNVISFASYLKLKGFIQDSPVATPPRTDSAETLMKGYA